MVDESRKHKDIIGRDAAKDSSRTVIAAIDVGITLTISDKALREIDRLQEKDILAAQDDRKFSWR